ncbi:hypothetical protein Acsp06_47800 [Actinomycetospora sp. NBRC 106375]|uniref:UGSC family (seleno)protein n=1 Tax=Actinomycetospora sp. NBRC 106375 TaxID=3032207 RepID=UPI0024A1F958|nr:hypothetical protein [Actinomycetospora sp. NBRC 106375]GLZ48595.1 hypothetical protein Acsp06_47800 [Actinomycetospora sp. NBRC 106375]
MRIVDPTSGATSEDTTVAAAAGTTPAGAVSGLRRGSSAALRAALCGLSNSKPGAHDLLDAIGRRLADEHGLGPNGLEAKPSAAVGADPALLDHLAAQYRLAVVAIGD